MVETVKASIVEVRQQKERPKVEFYCMDCNLFFKIDGNTLLDDAKCPKCDTYNVCISLEFGDSSRPDYIS